MGGGLPCGQALGPGPTDASHRQGPPGPLLNPGGNYPDTGGCFALVVEQS